jgi:S-adenosylmethionine hydrolase
MRKTVALLTDFGLDDVYVGVMKGVMRGICAEVDFIDVTHRIEAQSVREGAFALLNSYAYFPQGTVFLVIVDPAVGSARRPIAVQAGGYAFVAPDNGVLSYTLRQFDDLQAVELNLPQFHRQSISATFHGRDVFAPVAAHLAEGRRLDEIGTPISGLFEFPLPYLEVEAQRIMGEVLHIDHFGNVITSIGKVAWREQRLELSPIDNRQPMARFGADSVVIYVQDERIFGVQRAYHEVERGQLLAQIDSNGYLELAVNQGNAAKRLQLTVGDRIEIRLSED